jgi:formate hydrogenlyase transcriptional activator
LAEDPICKQEKEGVCLLDDRKGVFRIDEEFCIETFEKYRSLVFALGQVVYEHRIADKVIIWSGGFEKVLGYNEKEMGNGIESWLGRVHPEDLPAVKAEFENVTREDRLYDLEYRFRQRDGRYLWMHDRGKMIVDQHSKPLKVIGVFRDITKRKQAENELIRVNEELEDLKNRLHAENIYLQEEIRLNHNFENIIGKSDPMQQVLNLVQQVAPTDSTVLILGETGTGKELIARAIHSASRRNHKPLIKVDCASIPPALIESEFFGHEKGAFTGATRHREGRFALADGGTIFLDEIGELPKDIQAKLLRILQEGEFEAVGSSKTRKVDIRVIAATNRDLSKALNEGAFRVDLYYRLNVFPIKLPPLRERVDDIPLLASFFAKRFAQKMGWLDQPLTEGFVEKLMAYTWPGNVREIQNVIEHAMITSKGNKLNPDFVLTEDFNDDGARQPAHPEKTNREIRTHKQMIQLERENLIAALAATHWRVAGSSGAAQLLGIPASTLSSRMKALGIKRPG